MNGLSHLTMKQLRAFVAVYRSRRLATAAQRLSVTSSAVSVLIRQIEASLATRLFDRTTRSLEPTAAAHAAIGLAERILQSVEMLETNCRELSERQRGHVHVAVTPAIGAALMPRTVRAFTQACPDIQLVIDDCAPDQFLARILTDQVEFGIGTPEDITAEIDVRTLVADHLCVVCAADHPLAAQRQVRWVDLASVPVIAVRPGYGVRRTLDRVAGAARVELRIVNEVNFMGVLMDENLISFVHQNEFIQCICRFVLAWMEFTGFLPVSTLDFHFTCILGDIKYLEVIRKHRSVILTTKKYGKKDLGTAGIYFLFAVYC